MSSGQTFAEYIGDCGLSLWIQMRAVDLHLFHGTLELHDDK